MRSLDITVAGQTFQIRSDADEDYIQRLAREITQRFGAVKKSTLRQNQELKAMSMVAIALLDELISERKHSAEIKAKARDFATQLIAKIDDLLAGDVT